VLETAGLYADGPVFADVFTMSAGLPFYPSASILSSWADRNWRQVEGVQLDTLEHMQRLIVRTYRDAYEIFVRDGASGDVLVRGGRFFQAFTEAKLTGCSLGGSFLKQYGVYVGLRLEFSVGGETLLTAPVLGISLCPLELAART
jgi:hypothetical protein